MRDALKGRSNDPSMASLLITYTLSKALAISPLEILKMPSSLVVDLLYIHKNVEALKAEAIDNEVKKVK